MLKRPFLKLRSGLLLVCLLGSSLSTAQLASTCDQDCLYGFLDQYLNALDHQQPYQVPWSSDARVTENNVELPIGEGLWGTITELGDYDLRFADVSTGQIGFFGEVRETTAPTPFALRMKVDNGAISEVETIVFRQEDEGIPFPTPEFHHKPVLHEILKAEDRRPRARMISIADGYFDTLQLNDGQIFTTYAEDCNRVENGFQTTNNKDFDLVSIGGMSCIDQFKSGNFIYDDRLRARRYHVIDEERGLVFSSAFIDHSGRVGTYTLTNGDVVESPVRRPHSFALLELFKIKNGEIQQIEAVFITVPYYMPSPWDQ